MWELMGKRERWQKKGEAEEVRPGLMARFVLIDLLR